MLYGVALIQFNNNADIKNLKLIEEAVTKIISMNNSNDDDIYVNARILCLQ